MNRIVVIILLLGLFLIGSCGSNNTSNQSINEPKCAICGKSLKEETAYQADCVDGVSRTVCVNCYAIGKQFGKCF